MTSQTHPAQVFTVFGAYVFEQQNDYRDRDGQRANNENHCGTERMESAGALLQATPRSQLHQFSLAA